MKNKKILYIIIVLLIIPTYYIYDYIESNSHKIIKTNKEERIKNNKGISILLETDIDSGEYIEQINNTWPTENYIINEELTKCINGSKVVFNKETKEINIESTKTDKCYIYFKKYSYVTIDEVLASVPSNNSIRVDVTATKGTNNIDTYYYKINDGNWVTDNSNHTFTGLTTNTEYTIRVKVADTIGIYSDIDVSTYEIHTVTLSCTNCTGDANTKQVLDGDNVTFNISVNANNTYNLRRATTSNCTFNNTNNKASISNVQSDITCNIVAKRTTLEDKIFVDNSTISERSNFSVAFGDNTTGTIFKTNRTDDDSEVYYYAGNTTNNWVIFGDNGAGTYYYWRIIRTNSDEEGNGVRLLYSGSGSSATTIPSDLTNGYATTSRFNENHTRSEDAGYMWTVGSQHGTGTDSTIKTAVEGWYTTSGLTNFESYINTDAVYCNDRSVATGTTWASSPSSDYTYAAFTRLSSNTSPTHKCGGNTSGGYYESASNRLADRFSASSNGGGNGLLSKPIGLMTPDEVSFAGGVWAVNNPNVWFYANGAGSSITGEISWFLGSAAYWFTSSST